jgi:citrate lyase gamma subunit
MLSQKEKSKLKAVKNITSWASAGPDAYKLAQQVESAKLNGEIVPVTKKNLEITVRGAIKQFFDGNISTALKKKLEKDGLDMNRIREQVTEETLVTALQRIVAEGDIERLVGIADLAGEKPAEDIPTNAKKVVRERVEIILDD